MKRSAWILVDNVKPSITSYCVQNLLEGNEYLFRVYAENTEGLSKAMESSEIAVPKRPAGLTSYQISLFQTFMI